MYRAATLGDAAFISGVVIASWRDSYRDFLPASLLASLDRNSHHDPQSWERRLSEPSAVTRIICNGDADVGVLRLTIGTSSVPGIDAHLTTLYLLRQARGRGLGSEALAFVRTEVVRQHAHSLGVCVLAGNRAGQRFYERWGARRIGERVVFRLNEKPIFDVLYRFNV